MKRLLRQLLTLIFVLILLIILANFIPAVEEMLMAPINLAEGMAVSVEIQQIQSAVVRHIQVEGSVPNWSVEEFSAFIRGNFSTRGRDPSLDFWNRPYYFTQLRGGSLLVASLGPDGIPNSDDDIKIEWRVTQ